MKSREILSTDPVQWIKEALGIELWSAQCDIARAVAAHRRVSVRSGHKTGKSNVAACLALWWPHAHPRGRVILTATTNAQIRNVLWKEIRRLCHGASVSIPKPAQLPLLGVQWEDGREIIGFSTSESERMAGLSGDQMLFIVDEASGVHERIFEVIEGNRAGGASLLMLGNPTQPVGEFYDSFHSKSQLYTTFHVSSQQAALASPHPPGLATAAWCEEKLSEWGPNDPRYQVRVEGNYADSSEFNVVPLATLSAAQDRWDDMPTPTSRLELGVDVARFGDDETVVAVRRGKKILEVVTRSKLDEHEVSKLVLVTAARHRSSGEQKPLVKVDACGVGLGVVSILRQSEEINVFGVNAAEPASNAEEFQNVRSQLWFAAADWLADGGAIPADPKLETDLLAPRYDFDARNRRRVEKKEDIKRRIHRSPDRADAVCLAIYTPQARLVTLPSLVSASSSRPRRVASGYRLPKRGY